jgi:hypothetical protein
MVYEIGRAIATFLFSKAVIEELKLGIDIYSESLKAISSVIRNGL